MTETIGLVVFVYRKVHINYESHFIYEAAPLLAP